MNQKQFDFNDCKHEKANFIGECSLIGNYYCDTCHKKIDPVEYHRMRGYPHYNLKLEDYPEEFRSKMIQMDNGCWYLE